MTMQNGLRAGAIGAIAAVVLAVLGAIPLIGCCASILTLVLWVGVGVLAGNYGFKTNPYQTGGQAAQAGAVAGVITALAGGLVNTIIAGIQSAMGGSAQVLSQIPPDQLEQLREVGVDPAIFAGGAMAIVATMACCCLLGPLVAAGLGAIGGAISPSIVKRT